MPDYSPPPLEYELLDPESPHSGNESFEPPRRWRWLHLLLFLLTILSTLCIGARMQFNFDRNLASTATDNIFQPWIWALSSWHRLLLGIPFSASVLGILFAHEMGHYVLCVRRRVAASWPFFLPAPTLLGTFGAFIRIKSHIESRKDLFDIGIAGPIAGFVVAMPVLLFSLTGAKLATPLPAGTEDTSIHLGLPLIFKLAHWLLRMIGSPVGHWSLDQLLLPPTAIAAWGGMFATSLNLIPGGQLDGGHLIFALNPRAHRLVSRLSILVLIPLAWFGWAGWLLWAIVLRLTGYHPDVPLWPGLDRKRRLLALLALIMLALTFVLAPIPDSGIHDLIQQWKS